MSSFEINESELIGRCKAALFCRTWHNQGLTNPDDDLFAELVTFAEDLRRDPKDRCDRIEELEARLAKAEADRDFLRERSDAHGAEVERLCAKLKAADHVCEAALSVACEDGIRHQLLAYNMGLAMIQRLNDWTRLRPMKTG